MGKCYLSSGNFLGERRTQEVAIGNSGDDGAEFTGKDDMELFDFGVTL
jgi:hypothetical protein